MNQFVHLHVHTEYSLLDGAARIGKLIKTVKENGMKSIAITDHGNLYGIIAFYDECKKHGIKPIIGCEMYVCDDLNVKSGKTKLAHLVLLVKNEIGYKNLCMLNTISFREGFYYKPRIDYKTLKNFSEGLICLSGCLAGDIPKYCLKNMDLDAEKLALELKDMFGKDDFYIEIQDAGLPEQKVINPKLLKLAKKIGVKTVATNDVHYIYKEDSEMQDVLMCVQMGKTIDDPDRLKFPADEYYLKTPFEMNSLFADNKEAIESTLEIAEKCNFIFEDLDKNNYHFPKFNVPEGKNQIEFFRELVQNGLKNRYNEITSEILMRAELEIEHIIQQGFVEYFLVVWDYIDAAKKMGVSVGPGRGSGAGSIVAYALGITNIDPLRFGLLFERFLHSERVTAPDFDIDFSDDKRGYVIDYVKNKYGEDKVVKIVTFGTMAAKNAIKDVGRALKVSYSELDKVTKAIPNISSKHNDVIKKCFGFYKAKEGDKDFDVDYSISELVETYNTNADIKKVVDIAMKIEGMPRQCSTHACGLLIGNDSLDKFIPLSRNGDDITTQFNMTDVERLGHLKMDFLGLRNLNDIQKCIIYVKTNHNIDINFNNCNYDDPEVFKLIATGNTKAIFQLESSGFQKFMRELKPTSIEDIIAGVSLYRPGPMDSIPRYVHNKHNPQDVEYDHPILEPILNVTYGCIVYQEQVMKIVQDMAGYTLGQADIVRRIMGKKKPDEMKKEKQVFIYGKPAENGKPAIEGALKRGISLKIAEKVWSEMETFASYAFNKSHAAAYSLITYQTAFLKRYYKPEFLTAVLNNRITNSDEIKEYTTYAKAENLEILPPDINLSYTYFTSKNSKIRFGLAALKNVGVEVINSIIKEREENGEFKDFFDFMKRVENQALNKRCLESLILSGAFDSFGVFRSQLMQIYEQVAENVIRERKRQLIGQFSFFDEQSDYQIDYKTEYPKIKEFNKETRLKLEKEVAGVYISGHPLEDYISKFDEFNFNSSMILKNLDIENDNENIEDSEEINVVGLENNMLVTCGGIIVEVKKLLTRNSNKEMAFVKIEDIYGTIDVMFFPGNYLKNKPYLIEDEFVIIKGKLSIRDSEPPTVIADIILPWEKKNGDENQNASILKLYLKFDVDNLSLYNDVQKILSSYEGDNEVIIKSSTNGKTFSLKNKKVLINNHLLNELYGIINSENVIVR